MDDWLDGVDPGFGHWLAGFTDGEGSFIITKFGRGLTANGTPLRPWPNCRYEVSLRMDDAEILAAIRRNLGFGNLAIHTKPNPLRPNEQGAMRYVVNRIDDCARIVAFFRRFPLRAKKLAQFEVWARGVDEMRKGRMRSDERMVEIRAELSALRHFVPPTAMEIAAMVLANPPIPPRRIDKGVPPSCLCGCGSETRILSHATSVAHPDNPNFGAFSRGHNRRVYKTGTFADHRAPTDTTPSYAEGVVS